MVYKMPLEKAKKVVKEFQESNYNAKKALINAGYSESTASKQSKSVINSAIKTVARQEIEEIVSSSNPMGTLLQRVGLTRDQLLGEYLKIIFQDKDMSNKLKAMMPLLKPEGIAWDDELQKTVPTLNLTVKQNVDTTKPVSTTSTLIAETVNAVETAQRSPLTDDVAQDILSVGLGDTDEHAADDVSSDDVDSQGDSTSTYGIENVNSEGGGVDMSFIGIKEGVSHIPKNSEIHTIDNQQ